MRYVCPKDVEENVVRTGKINLLEEVGSEARERGIEGRYLARASSGSAAKEDKRKGELISIVTQPANSSGRRLGAERLFDIGWSDQSKCQAYHNEEGTEKQRLCHGPEWNEVRREIPETFRKWEQKARTSKEWKWQRSIVTHRLSKSQWNRVIPA